jgi:hypothetical protein
MSALSAASATRAHAASSAHIASPSRTAKIGYCMWVPPCARAAPWPFPRPNDPAAASRPAGLPNATGVIRNTPEKGRRPGASTLAFD